MDTKEKYNLESISKILDEVDVMGIIASCPPDEYSEEAKMIIEFTCQPHDRNITETRISKIVSMVFNLQFSSLDHLNDKEIVGKQEKFDLIAKKIMALIGR